MTRRILIIEDDNQIRNFNCFAVENMGLEYTAAANGAEATAKLLSERVDLILLDLGLPDMDGMEIIKKVREWSEMPIIVVSARDQDKEKAAALDAGADDYLTKPFETEECLARVYALLRRFHELNPLKTRAYSIVAHGDLMMKRDTRQALISGRPLELTYREYELLNLFMSHPERVFTFEQLYEQVWAEPYMGNKNSVVCEMKRLRKKLGDTDPIEAVREVGYRFKKE